MDTFTDSVVIAFDEPFPMDEQTYAGRREVLFFFVLGALCVPPLFFLPIDPGEQTAIAIPVPFASSLQHLERTFRSTLSTSVSLWSSYFTRIAFLRRASTFVKWAYGSNWFS